MGFTPVKPVPAMPLRIAGLDIYLTRKDWEAIRAALVTPNMAADLRERVGNLLDMPITTCSHCGGPLEMYLRIDLNDVALKAVPPRHPDDWRSYLVDGYMPASSANFPDSGIVNEEAVVKCVDCGEHVDGVDLVGVGHEWSHVSDAVRAEVAAALDSMDLQDAMRVLVVVARELGIDGA